MIASPLASPLKATKDSDLPNTMPAMVVDDNRNSEEMSLSKISHSIGCSGCCTDEIVRVYGTEIRSRYHSELQKFGGSWSDQVHVISHSKIHVKLHGNAYDYVLLHRKRYVYIQC